SLKRRGRISRESVRGSTRLSRRTILSPMSMDKRRWHTKQWSMWVATEDLPRSAAHPFHTRLNQIFNKHDFDDSIEELGQRFYAEHIGRPGTLVVYTS